MERLIAVHDKAVITEFLMRDPLANVLVIGDLDDFFWPSTVWYGWEVNENLVDIALLYVGAGLPVLLCFAEADDPHAGGFCNMLQTVLPAAVYTHLYPDVDRFFSDQYRFVPHGRHYKMALREADRLEDIDTRGVVPLSPSALPAIQNIFDTAYPGNFFDPRMLETGMYYGIWENEQLVSVAGIHVYSEEYDVAAIGNVTTHPAYRNRGLAKQVMAKLIQALQQKVHHITLNVKQENRPAIRVYEQLGFQVLRAYDEFEFYRRNSPFPAGSAD